MKKKPLSPIIRIVFQSVFFAISMAILAFIIIAGKKAIHNICPYSIACFGLQPDVLLSRLGIIFLLGNLIGLLVLISSVFLGRKFCSYVCPLGSYQEAIFSLRSRRYRIKQIIPFYMERKLGKLKYLVLIFTVGLVLGGVAYLYINFCPFYALSSIPRIAIGGLLVLLITTIGALFLHRFWCRFLCPYAALLNIFQALGALFGIRRLKIMRNIEACNDCGFCRRVCPMNINLAESIYVDDLNCIHCGICAQACPKECIRENCREDK